MRCERVWTRAGWAADPVLLRSITDGMLARRYAQVQMVSSITINSA